METPSKPGPSKARKSDADLLREHGIDRECRVVLSSAPIADHGEELDSLMPKKAFRVHYGRHFLWQIAQLSYRHPVSSIDLDRLYSTYITSPFSSLDRPHFKSVLRSYFTQWECDFKQRRAQLIKAKLDELNARRKAERDAQRLVKITYHGKSVVVPRCYIEAAKAALKNESRSRVLIERIFVDETPTTSKPEVVMSGDDSNLPNDKPIGSPQSTTDVSDDHSNAAPESVLGDDEMPPYAEDDSDESPDSQSSQGMISPGRESPLDPFLLLEEKKEDRRTAIDGLIIDLIAKVSQEQDHNRNGVDMSSTDCYSDDTDTVESPMEEDFGAGVSPDLSKVLRDSDETCHGDEFYEEVTSPKQQSLPNGNAEIGSCVIQKTITRGHESPIIVMKL